MLELRGLHTVVTRVSSGSRAPCRLRPLGLAYLDLSPHTQKYTARSAVAGRAPESAGENTRKNVEICSPRIPTKVVYCVNTYERVGSSQPEPRPPPPDEGMPHVPKSSGSRPRSGPGPEPGPESGPAGAPEAWAGKTPHPLVAAGKAPHPLVDSLDEQTLLVDERTYEGRERRTSESFCVPVVRALLLWQPRSTRSSARRSIGASTTTVGARRCSR